jgi:hypothetical protein
MTRRGLSRRLAWGLALLALVLGPQGTPRAASAGETAWPDRVRALFEGGDREWAEAKEAIERALRSEEAPEVVPHLAATGHPDALELLVAALDAKPVVARAAIVRGLASFRGHASTLAPRLIPLLATAELEVERELVRALVHLRCPASRDWLLKQARGDGLGRVAPFFDCGLRTDVLFPLVRGFPETRPILVRLAGEDLGADAAPWCAWVEKLAKDRGHAREDGSRSSAIRTEPERFYGIPIPRGDFVFLIDASGSMRVRMEEVKSRVVEVIERFRPDRRFNIVFFADRPKAFLGRLLPATESARKSAVRFVRAIQSRGETDYERAFDAVLRDENVREIVMLSDGAPSTGALRTADQILARLGDRRIRIHAVATSYAADLLREIAKRTGGKFRILR